jgi:hypothetical protein
VINALPRGAALAPRHSPFLPEPTDVADKPASRPIAKALPRNNRWVGQFALPGLVPDQVRERGELKTFQTADEAETAALRALFGLLVSRTTAEFAVSLDSADITPTYFAEIYGVPQHRVMKWLDGEQDIPHSVRVLVELLKTPENFDLAASITRVAQDPSSR